MDKKRIDVVHDVVDEIEEEIITCIVIREESKLRDTCFACDYYKFCRKIFEIISGANGV